MLPRLKYWRCYQHWSTEGTIKTEVLKASSRLKYRMCYQDWSTDGEICNERLQVLPWVRRRRRRWRRHLARRWDGACSRWCVTDRRRRRRRRRAPAACASAGDCAASSSAPGGRAATIIIHLVCRVIFIARNSSCKNNDLLCIICSSFIFKYLANVDGCQMLNHI